MQLPAVQQAAQGAMSSPAQSAMPSQMAVNRVPGHAQAQMPMSGGMVPGAMGAASQLPAVQQAAQSTGITPQMPIPQRAAGGPRFSGK